MSEYSPRFAEHRIDMTVLAELSDDDLREMGLVLGDRRRILRALAEDGGVRGGVVRREDAERKHLIVLFCDLVGSTELAAKLGAEEWREVVGAYIEAASAAVRDFGGHVAKTLGDGLMALFGFPYVHENDGERAALAALEILTRLEALNEAAAPGAAKLAARIGVASGLVVVDSAGEVYGDAPNIASRIQALAAPGSVVATEAVHREIAGVVIAEQLGAHNVRGVADPVVLFRVVRRSGARPNLRTRVLTPLIGRNDEIAALSRRWERARLGEGQFVLVSAEAGLGKSRLIEEFRLAHDRAPLSWVHWNCSQLRRNTAFHPLAEWGRQRFDGDLPDARRFADLERALRVVGLDADSEAPFLAALVDIATPADRPVRAASREEMRRGRLRAAVEWTLAGARAQPLVLACEDLHWADPSTLELLGTLAERGFETPLLVIATCRPEFRPAWPMRAHHATITLAPLGARDVRRMVREIAARDELTSPMVESVAARTGGVPLYVEEVTRLVLERRGEADVESIPPTLQQSLAARIDRLGAARDVALTASVFGREFAYAPLAAVADVDDVGLRAALDALVAAGVVDHSDESSDTRYRFKHALIRDAAYENLLKSRRQILHRRVAEAFEAQFAAEAESAPEIVAHHYTQGGRIKRAVTWWRKAAEQAARRSAFAEAIAHFERAVELADAADLAGNDRRDRLKLQTAYASCLLAARGYSVKETAAAFARAQQLADGIDDAGERSVVRYGLFTGALMRGEMAAAGDMREAFLRDAHEAPSKGLVGIAHRAAGLVSLFTGHFKEAAEAFETAAAAYESARDGGLAFSFGQDPGVAATASLGLASWPLGDADRAVRCLDEAFAAALAGGHAYTIAYAAVYRLIFEFQRKRPDVAKTIAADIETLGEKHDMRLVGAFAVFARGWLGFAAGDHRAGLALIEEGLARLDEQGFAVFLPGLFVAQADCLIIAGAADRARENLKVVAAQCRKTGVTWELAEVHRATGDACAALGETQAAGTAYREALEVARAQGARGLELRAALAAAKAMTGTADAVEALRRAASGFTPTPEFPEVEMALTFLAKCTEGVKMS